MPPEGELTLAFGTYDEATDHVEKQRLESEMTATIPLPRKVDMFDLSNKGEWVQGRVLEGKQSHEDESLKRQVFAGMRE